MSEPLPSAVARGLQAQTPSAIQPVRAGIVAGALALLFALIMFSIAPVPDRALALVGGDPSEVGRAGGMRIVWEPPPGADLAQIERIFLARHRGGHVSRDGDVLVVEVGGVPPESVTRAAAMLTAGGLAFHRTVITEAMPNLAREYGVGLQTDDAIHLEIDQWQPEDGGRRQQDFYLVGETREAIAGVLDAARERGWALPEGTRIAYERVEPWAPSEHRAFWRTYVIETAPALGGEHIANAMASYDPNTNRPIILLDFDRDGARIFGEVTASLVGQKLATVLGGDVTSAPIINGPIRGGRASITMGGTDPRAQEAERDAMIGVLSSGQLPAGGTLREARYLPPSVTAVQEWLARLVTALAAALLVGLVAWSLVRRTRPVWRTPAVRLPGTIAWERAAVLLVAPVTVIAASVVTAPGIDEDALWQLTLNNSQLSIGMLGLTPLLSSFLLVELVATLVPRWRARRHAGPTARLPFDVATLLVALVLALAQAWFTLGYLDHADAGPVGFDRLLFLTSVAGTTLGFAFIAWCIRVYGAGSGYGALLVTGFAVDLYLQLAPSHADRRLLAEVATTDSVLALAWLAVLAIGVGIVLRTRISRIGEVPLRIPTSGIAALTGAGGAVQLLIVAIGALPIGSFVVFEARAWLDDVPRTLLLGVVALLVIAYAWAFARPAVIAPFARRARLEPPSWATWRAATALSLVTILVFALAFVMQGRIGSLSLVGMLPAAITAAFVLDVVDDLRGRRGKLAYVWSLQSAQHADIAAHVLENEQVTFHLSGVATRTLFAWFGPFAPIDVWVRREDVARARELLANVFAAK